ncbi:hypothetical protein KDK95_08135 [Actinospica sp. MGRD01-02]|uniref:Uncharacterized protein n=1 Tax=Actinospica acidithermotolerans TaxID=2828514 RepID=A0A941E4S9_9ACTN|nr:hypothetical protein [Actinospica acidithermotolerans]MBR7826265.1 hypothetical protein [Actinospica acidithermotolerans]
MSTALKASDPSQRRRRERRAVTRIAAWLLGIALLAFATFAIYFIAAVMYAAATASR